MRRRPPGRRGGQEWCGCRGRARRTGQDGSHLCLAGPNLSPECLTRGVWWGGKVDGRRSWGLECTGGKYCTAFTPPHCTAALSVFLIFRSVLSFASVPSPRRPTTHRAAFLPVVPIAFPSSPQCSPYYRFHYVIPRATGSHRGPGGRCSCNCRRCGDSGTGGGPGRELNGGGGGGQIRHGRHGTLVDGCDDIRVAGRVFARSLWSLTALPLCRPPPRTVVVMSYEQRAAPAIEKKSQWGD